MNSVVPSGFRFSDIAQQEITTGSMATWTSIMPRGPLQYSHGDEINFELSSLNQFASLSTAYIKFDVVLDKETPNTAIDGVQLAYMGFASAISRVRTTVNNKPIEDLDRYQDDTKSDYSVSSNEKQKTLQALEGLNHEMSSTPTIDRYTVIHYPNSNFMRACSNFPLPFANFHLTLNVAPLTDIFYSNSAVPNPVRKINIENLSLNVKLSSVNPLYLSSVFSSLEAGSMIKIPFCNKRRVVTAGNDSTRLNCTISTGQCQSLRYIKSVMKVARGPGNGGLLTGQPQRHMSAYLKSWHISPSNGTRLPISRDWTAVEAIATMVSSFTDPQNPYLNIDTVAWATTYINSKDYRLAYSFKPNSGVESDQFFMDALEVVSGWINLNLEFDEPFLTSSEVITYAGIDTIAQIGRGTVSTTVFA